MSAPQSGDYRNGGAGFGNKLQAYELDAMGRFHRLIQLARCEDTGPSNHALVEVRMTVPDSRLIATLTFQFIPSQPGYLLDGVDPSTIHLMATEDCGDGPQPVEDLLGTAAAPLPLQVPPLRGLTYSPTEEVQAMRADLDLYTPVPRAEGTSVPGLWVARATWQAMRPISELDWRNAVSLCKLESSPSVTVRIGRGGE